MKLFFVAVFVISCVCCYSTGDDVLSDESKYTFYTRKDWGAVSPTNVHPLKTPVEYVIIHHTYIPVACNTTEQCSADMRSMQKYHNTLGWGDIGYNFCVGSEGGAYEGRGWHTKGIHAGNANGVSVGICLIGDWRVERPPQQQLDTTKELIETGVAQGAISPNYKLIGHLQAMQTECPGGALMQEISQWDHYVPGHIPFSKLIKDGKL